MKNFIASTILIIVATLVAEPPTGDWILKKLDENAVSDNKIMVANMIIHGRRASRTIKAKSWVQGTAKSFTEFLAPAREKGTKMLKLKDELWTYTPETDRTIKISGHMLRQSVMGSDLSYEDMMEDPLLENLYNAKVVGEDTLIKRPCWILELTAKSSGVAYHSRKIWVDKDHFVVLKEERYATSGKLLKSLEAKILIQTDGRWIQSAMVFRDMLKQGEGTEFLLDSIRFNAKIPDYIFSKAALKK